MPQDAPGVGQRPQDVPHEHDVEPLLADGRCRRVTEQEHRVASGELGAGQVDHARRAVDPGDVVAPLGREERQAAGTAAEVEHVGRGLGQPGPQPLRPRLPHDGVAQPVVQLVTKVSAWASQSTRSASAIASAPPPAPPSSGPTSLGQGLTPL